MTFDVDVAIYREKPDDVWPVRVTGYVGAKGFIDWSWWTWVEIYSTELIVSPRYRTFREVYL